MGVEEVEWAKAAAGQETRRLELLCCRTADYALAQDKSFKQWVKKYAADESLFFADFSKAFGKLLELGVPSLQWVSPEPWELKTVEEQSK
ncbi:hypothetical protein BU17DRAFT_92829 [Hysterangium stoloniferum]|nr:hypothetical protein BU17DRAFT_92829 [Hysterangium stoloniferum]